MNGQTALVTGASSGIGADYARAFAAQGADLILVARREDKLAELAAELRSAHGRQVDVVAADLSLPDVGRDVAARVEALGRTVDILVNNAGFATHGALAAADPDRLVEQIQLNCVAVVDLTRRFLPGMTARGRGTVINVASTAAFQPIPHMAVYGATKAFVLSFSEALWAETRPKGVRVIAVCPGATQTEFFEVVGTDDAAVGPRRTTEQVVATTLRGLRRGAPSVIDGAANSALARLTRLIPKRLLIAIAGRAVAPKVA
ncbi:short-chain dehydrogenase/reductase SDR [Alloactinosynnema sp. L-07]|uniref:SDR family NAD(P)-dependent oxidoreductase n=1 Tax=Alloactinosynnema sp. L-07 TaxID=1653480 RepID=UPI00065F0103|nr:SDR family oxidoreductase [Alloactinosynnema sp. L-07]CRK57160.1 short-chain dehydrogenase/reductase SDR [Alloactinosynnema sp. L-07]